MSKKLITTVGLVLGLTACLASAAFAGIPFAPFSTCGVVITQFAARSQCINNFTPDVVRLCPSTATQIFDSVTFNLTILDALAAPVSGATLTAYETSGAVNITTGGATTTLTTAAGKGSITVSTGSGCGKIGICAGGVLICEVSVRSPDNAFSGISCNLPTSGTSFVNASDKTNGTCGFNPKFGTVTVGVNDCWDLTCDNVVSANDVQGILGKGGYNQHTSHGGVLGPKSTCP